MMSPRTALATALAVVLTVTTASLAVAANLGMFNEEEPVGQLTPVTASADDDPVIPTDAATIYVDEHGNVLPSAPPNQALPAGPSAEASPAPARRPGVDDQLGDDEDRTDQADDDGQHDEHEEHEGRDDDD